MPSDLINSSKYRRWLVIDSNLNVVDSFSAKCLARGKVKKEFPFKKLEMVSIDEFEIMKLEKQIKIEEEADNIDKEKIKSLKEKILSIKSK